ncbi:dodecin family protein [Hyphomonas oceanitis]|uniref:Dodecin domain-containing protein n=1 Tax=Hyphomonas oceanitis SCH89 TaxID=1280953 RepID=A0A059G3C9_9PROT|nr:dodecin domain-containing protein [Hyphomonas oceanitis]KDA01311.1 hypothetical protein HOC_16236 [Hyphomonas oceanitis SCH89]
MASTTYTTRQITGTSDISVDDAIARALNVARQRFSEPEWFDVVTARGFLSNGNVSHYQVTLDLGYAKERGTLEDDRYFTAACSGRKSEMYHTVDLRL